MAQQVSVSLRDSTFWMLAAGHTKAVLDLAAPSDYPGLLVSLSMDGNIRLWHASHEECTASYSSEALSLVSLTIQEGGIIFVGDWLYNNLSNSKHCCPPPKRPLRRLCRMKDMKLHIQHMSLTCMVKVCHTIIHCVMHQLHGFLSCAPDHVYLFWLV